MTRKRSDLPHTHSFDEFFIFPFLMVVARDIGESRKLRISQLKNTMMFITPVIRTSLFFLPKEESNILCKMDNSTLKSEFGNKSKLKLAFFILII